MIVVVRFKALRNGCHWPGLTGLAALASIAFALVLPARALDPDKSIGQFTHTSWSVKDGIPGPVLAIAQTPEGYLWFGTYAGLYRFDGQDFHRWEPEAPGDNLPASSITALLTAADGSLWIGFASSAVSCLRHGALKTYTRADGLHTGGVLSIAEDRNGCIWAGGASGFSRFAAGKWSRVGVDLGYPAPGARELLVDHLGTLWAATDGLNFGLSKDSVRVNTILKLPANGKQFEATGQPVGYVAQLAEAPDGKVWMVEGSGPGPTVRPVEGRSNQNIERAVAATPWCILFDQNVLWIGLLRDGIRRALDFRRLDQVSFDRFESKDGLSSDGLHAAFKDREGNIWFGTNRGVDRFRENKATPFAAKEGLSPNPQLALASTRDGNVWILNYARDLVQRYSKGRIINQFLPRYSPSDSTRLLSISSDKNRVWLGGSFGLAESTDGRFSYLRVPGTRVGTNVEAIAPDSSGDLWIEVWEGDKSSLKRLRQGNWEDFQHRPGLPDTRCRVLFGDAGGRVWLGFETGDVVVYDNDRFRHYSASDGLPAGKVLSITGDRGGHIWIGGEGGLSQFDAGHFVTLTQENGLPGHSVSAALEDDDGSLWIAGELGIVRVKPQELQTAFRSRSYRMQRLFFDTTDGLPGLPSQDEPFPTAAKSADGRLWFTTTDGIAAIDPRRIPMNAVPPPVVIQTVTADNRKFALAPQPYLPPKAPNLKLGFAALSFSIPERVAAPIRPVAASGRPYSAYADPVLPPHTTRLRIAYSVLSLSIPERVRSRYRLVGSDVEWQDAGARGEAPYNNLGPGEYTFQVSGCNNDGVWNEAGASLTFTILPAFYQTAWFRLFYFAASGVLIWLAYRLRLRQMTARVRLRYAERLAERTRIARDLHDTLLQNLAGVSLQLDGIAKQAASRPEKTVSLIGQVRQQVDASFQEARAKVWNLRSTSLEGDGLAATLREFCERVGASSAIRCCLHLAGQPRPLPADLEEEVLRIAQEAAQNAVRHARASEIRIVLAYAEKLLTLSVCDDGQGFDLEEGLRKADHWGLKNMRERAAQIHGVCAITSAIGEGTRVEVSIPAPLKRRKTVTE